jgi:hypothetical protein
MSGRIASHLFEQPGNETIRVQLAGRANQEPALPPAASRALRDLAGGELRLLPLADWREVVVPTLPDAVFARLPLEANRQGDIARASAAAKRGCAGALLAEGLLVLPVQGGGGVLRPVQCAATDPVSFALLAGQDHALFPTAPGLSPGDWARRAVTEHGAWLETDTPASPLDVLGRLFTAARAALFLESIAEGSPCLSLTVESTAAELAKRDSKTSGVVEDAAGLFRSHRLEQQRPPLERAGAALRRVVLELPAYAAESRRLPIAGAA